MEPLYRLIALWGVATAAGAEAQLKAPRSVITMYWRIIFKGFAIKLGAKITLYP